MTAPVIANPTTPVGIVLIDPATGLPYSATGGGGVAVSAGTNSVSSGTLVFSNSNGVTFGMSPGGVITATVTPGAAAGIAAVQLPNETYTSGTVNFINSNGLSFGSTTGGGVTASYTVPGSTVFSNSNNVSFGLAGSTVTATATIPTGLSAAAAGTQTQTSGTLVFANSNGLTFGMSNSSQVTGSYTVPGATVFSNSNNVSFGLNGSTVTATATFSNAASAGVSTGGNTSGNTGTYNGQLVFAGGNNITLSVSSGAAGAQTITISGANAAGAQTAISGVVVSDTTYTSGTISFSNANGISFGSSAGQAITASYTVPTQTNQTVGLYGLGNTTQNSSTTLDARSLSFNGLGAQTVGYSNGSIQLSVPPSSLGVSTGGNTSGNTGTLSGQMVLAGGNNITLSVATAAGGAQTITISAANAGGAQTGISGVVVSNTTYTSGTLSFSNANGISFGSSAGQAITASYTVPTQTNQTIGLYGLGNTTQNSSTTLDARSLSFNGLGEITVGYSNGSIQLSAPGQSIGVSSGGNTSGNTGTYGGQVVWAGGNNITLSVSSGAGGAQTITISGANAAGAQTAVSGIVVSNTTYTSGTVSFSNANGISFGSSAGQAITASYTVPTQTNQTIGLYALGNTTQNSSTTLDARTLSFNGLGELSVGYSNGNIQLSVPPSSLGVSTVGNTSGNTGTYSGQAIFAGGNNITLSVGTAAGGAQTITISGPTVPAQSNQSMGFYGVGNTTQNSSTNLDARSVSFDGLGAMTVGFSNGSIQLSAPVTSSISGTGAVSISVTGSTISIGAPNYGTLSYSDNGLITNIVGTQIGVGSVALQNLFVPANISISALREFISGSFSSSSNSSYAATVSVQAGLYTLNGSTLSLASSGSQSYAFTNTSSNSFSVMTGLKGLTIPLNASMTPGNYWLGLWSNTASAGANWATLSNVIQSNAGITFNGLFGSSAAATNQIVLGEGLWSTTSAAIPSSIGLSHITGTANPPTQIVNVYNVTA